jgi:hypothetical protein
MIIIIQLNKYFRFNTISSYFIEKYIILLPENFQYLNVVVFVYAPKRDTISFKKFSRTFKTNKKSASHACYFFYITQSSLLFSDKHNSNKRHITLIGPHSILYFIPRQPNECYNWKEISNIYLYSGLLSSLIIYSTEPSCFGFLFCLFKV